MYWNIFKQKKITSSIHVLSTLLHLLFYILSFTFKTPKNRPPSSEASVHRQNFTYEKLIKLIVVALFFIGFTPMKAQQIHAILAGSTNVSDIGKGCEVSIKKMESALEYIEAQTGIDVEITKITGNKFTKDNIVQEINNLNPKADDVVFFFSSFGIVVDDVALADVTLGLFPLPCSRNPARLDRGSAMRRQEAEDREPTALPAGRQVRGQRTPHGSLSLAPQGKARHWRAWSWLCCWALWGTHPWSGGWSGGRGWPQQWLHG